ncbi:hypothetical protein Taro_018603 [Colocasia esculenta]|uniref:Uncharacterized protein n=1 Tax=Colocasia esculenta TaxID=4460 RepID=A0A843UR64_COLES|nr:hypothetical protein [Colocasia esculenta]
MFWTKACCVFDGGGAFGRAGDRFPTPHEQIHMLQPAMHRIAAVHSWASSRMAQPLPSTPPRQPLHLLLAYIALPQQLHHCHLSTIGLLAPHLQPSWPPKPAHTLSKAPVFSKAPHRSNTRAPLPQIAINFTQSSLCHTELQLCCVEELCTQLASSCTNQQPCTASSFFMKLPVDEGYGGRWDSPGLVVEVDWELEGGLVVGYGQFLGTAMAVVVAVVEGVVGAAAFVAVAAFVFSNKSSSNDSGVDTTPVVSTQSMHPAPCKEKKYPVVSTQKACVSRPCPSQ